MIVDSFPFNHEDEHSWFNVFIEPVDIRGKTMYLVGRSHLGEGIPKREKLQEMALTAETITPFDETVSLEALCSYIRDSMSAGTWEVPFLISEEIIEMRAPSSAYEEGAFDAARGLHYNANPHAEGTEEADQWDEGWLAGRDGDFDDLKH